MNTTGKYQRFLLSRKNRKAYSTIRREPFYQIAKRYLPEGSEKVILDVGAGDGSFVTNLGLENKYRKVYLLDGNSDSVNLLLKGGLKGVLYRAPAILPFDDLSVDFIHCSHFIEHLDFREVHSFLKEIDRVLKRGGVFVISAPLMWADFYGDLSHIKPYNPEVILKYMGGSRINRTAQLISDNYQNKELVYRNFCSGVLTDVHSDFLLVDLLLSISRKILSLLRIKRYHRNGYTLVIEKMASPNV